MLMEILITEVIVNRFFPEFNFVEVFGQITCYLYVYNVNPDGSKQKCLRFDVPYALANGTILYGMAPKDRNRPTARTSAMVDILSIYTGDVISSESVFGSVNDNLITRALRMLMQTNADLFFAVVPQVLNNVLITTPKKMYDYLKEEDFEFKILESSAMLGITPNLQED